MVFGGSGAGGRCCVAVYLGLALHVEKFWSRIGSVLDQVYRNLFDVGIPCPKFESTVLCAMEIRQ